MTFRHWTPSCQLQPATTLKVGNPSPSNWQHRYLKVSSLQKSKLQPWGICINYKTPHSLMIKWYCGGMVRRPLRNLPVCSTLHCAELGHSLQPVPRCSCLYTQRMCPSVGTITHACMHVCMYVCMYVCMHVCMYVWMWAWVYVCMYVNIFIIWTSYIFFITIRFHSLCVRIDIHLRKALQFSLSFHDTVDSTHRYAKLGCCRSLAGIFSCL